MKQILFLIFTFVVVFSIKCEAQNYRKNKKVYDFHEFTPQMGDAFKPQFSYVGSAILPGMGQMMAGENKRGMMFLGAFSAGYLIQKGVITNSNNNGAPSAGGKFLGNTIMLATWIWAVVDAGRVAKVNSMYLRDRKHGADLSIEIAPVLFDGNFMNPRSAVGLELAFRF